jgi:hypothetical protein
MAEETEFPFTDKPNLKQAKRIADVTAAAHEKVEKRTKQRVAKVGSRQSIAASQRSAKKTAKKPARRTETRAGTKKRASVKRRTQKPATNR